MIGQFAPLKGSLDFGVLPSDLLWAISGGGCDQRLESSYGVGLLLLCHHQAKNILGLAHWSHSVGETHLEQNYIPPANPVLDQPPPSLLPVEGEAQSTQPLNQFSLNQ